MPTAGEVLQEVMRQRGVTAYRVSQLLGAGPNSVKNALDKGGAKMTLTLFRGICAALDISPGEVLDQLPPIELSEVPEQKRGRPKKA